MAGQGPAQCARRLEDPQVGPGRVTGLPRGSLPHPVVGASEDRPQPLDPFPQELVRDPFAAGDVPGSGPENPRLGAGGVPGNLYIPYIGFAWHVGAISRSQPGLRLNGHRSETVCG